MTDGAARAAAGAGVSEAALARIGARLRARREIAVAIVLVVLRQHQRGRSPAQIAAWMAGTFGRDNPAADEGLIRFVLATTGRPSRDTQVRR